LLVEPEGVWWGEGVSAESSLDQGREFFRRNAWGEAFAALSVADRETPIVLDDLERLAVAAYLVGRDGDSDDAWARAYRESVRRGAAARALRCAFWLAFRLLNAGDAPSAAGWIGRAQRSVDESDQAGAEPGYLQYLLALRAIFSGDLAAASAGFGQAMMVGDRFADADLATLARVGRGRSRIYLGEIADGVALLDEAMVAVTAGEVSAVVAGDTYCSVIEACQELFDVRRAQAWTTALSRWCDSQPDLVPYRGQCMVHRAEIMQLRGAWQDAVNEAERARECLSRPTHELAVAGAFYRLAELHRLRGEFAPAEKAYRRASELGRDPQPGLGLLRMAQGRLDSAVAAIRRAMDETVEPVMRSRLLPGYAEIMLAAGDTSAAGAAATELSELAAAMDAPLLRAVADHITGAVTVAEGDGRAALAPLRRAYAAWCELDVPYEAARVRVLIGLACRALGDDDTATLELEAARGVFARLGAKPDLTRLDHVASHQERGGLTPRELQVLRLVARGETNRAIAERLVVSERTVDRHVSNIFTKLGVSSRAAATAYAYRSQLV
jgi:DNA-binding CsgD family transcriptional regulator